MPDATRTRIADLRHRLSWLHESLREPVIARSWPEEIARAHDQHSRAFLARALQTRFHFHANRAFARDGMLWRVFVDEWKRVRPEVVDRARQHDGSALRLRRRDGVVDHRQHQFGPALIAWRIYRVHDHGYALCRAHHVGRVHRVAVNPFDAVALRCPRATPQPVHAPAPIAQLPRNFPADAARRPKYQNRFALRHVTPPRLSMTPFSALRGHIKIGEPR